MRWRVISVVWCATIVLGGCVHEPGQIYFPQNASRSEAFDRFYSVQSAHANFAVRCDPRDGPTTRATNLLAYSDAPGEWNRAYHLKDYANGEVPNLIILLDSIPFEAVRERYERGQFRYFDPPQKLIGTFPSLTEQIFTRILHAPPLPGMIDDYYDVQANAMHKGILKRTGGYKEPWEMRCNYSARYWEGGLSYIDPRDIFQLELSRAKEALDKSPDRVTVVYFVSASSMLCKYGRPGLNEVLDGVDRLCLQLLYERKGALKISMLADHGHNLMESTNVSLEQTLTEAGFHPGVALNDPNDVVMDMNGLVTYLGIHTHRAGPVTEVVRHRPEVELASYLDGDRVIVTNSTERAAVERRGERFRYQSIDGDVLGYEPTIARLKKAGRVDADGFIVDRDWFEATVDAGFPDGPRRLWDAFHGNCVNTPDVMVTFHDGYCCGAGWMHAFIHMASTHGGLNQVNTATFVMTMTGRVHGPLRSGDVMEALEPGYVLPIRDRK